MHEPTVRAHPRKGDVVDVSRQPQKSWRAAAWI